MAALREDVEIMMRLLERTVSPKYEVGFDIVGKDFHFVGKQADEHLGEMKENLFINVYGTFLLF